MPTGPEKPLGSFESWTKVIGGILDVAGIEGPLANAADLRAESQDTIQADFLRAAHAQVGDSTFPAREIIPLAREFLSLGDVDDSTAAQRLGNKLRMMKDRPMGGLVLRNVGTLHGGAKGWQIEDATAQNSSGRVSPVSPKPVPEQDSGGDTRAEGQQSFTSLTTVSPPQSQSHSGIGETGDTGDTDPRVIEAHADERCPDCGSLLDETPTGALYCSRCCRRIA